jgi:hypothetical protein
MVETLRYQSICAPQTLSTQIAGLEVEGQRTLLEGQAKAGVLETSLAPQGLKHPAEKTQVFLT